MKRKRIGNDINIAWAIMTEDGTPFDLSIGKVSLYLKNYVRKEEVKGFSIEGNVILWTFLGKNQKNLGNHSLELVINEDAEGMITTDACDFVCLVPCSCMEGGEDDAGVKTETLNLTSVITLGGGGGGGVAQLMTNVTYNELVTLRDDGALIPGMHYRITDYETMVSDIGESAEHPFDIIVTAISNNVIDEKARAIQSARDITGYFANSNLASWEVWYCLDNNKDRFINASVESNILVIQLEGESYGGLYDGTIEYDGKSYFSWRMDMGEESIYFLAINETPQTGDDVIILFGGEFLGNGSVAQHLLMKDGKGVIYRLIDEYGNDIPYDFKNVLMPRKLTNGEYDEESGIDTRCYTFTLYDDTTNTISDFSVSNGAYCYNNIMGKGCYDNVFLTRTALLSNEGAGCHSNIIGDRCQRCTFGDQCYGNTLGNDCSDNVVFYNFQNNICGDDFSQNIIDQSCVSNVIGKFFFRNNVGAVFQLNKIGNGCYENIFGSTFSYNELGNDCKRNIFAKTEDGVELSYATYFCKLGDGCSDNVIYGDRTYPDKMQNVHIEAGISGTEENKNIIKIPVMDAPYVQNVAKNSNGEIKIFCIADFVN